MNDVLPAEITAWQHLEQVARGIFEAYGYQELRVPILERTELFAGLSGRQATQRVDKLKGEPSGDANERQIAQREQRLQAMLDLASDKSLEPLAHALPCPAFEKIPSQDLDPRSESAFAKSVSTPCANS